MKHEHNTFPIGVLCILVAIALAGCSPNEAAEVGIMNQPEYEVVRLNNCGGKADATQVIERGQSVHVEREYGVTTGVDVFEGTVTERYGRAVSYSKSIMLTAPPNTYMRFIIQWQNEIHYGGVSRDEQFLALYQYFAPTDIQIYHQEDIGCGLGTEPPLIIPTGEIIISSLPTVWLPQSGDIPANLSITHGEIVSNDDIENQELRSGLDGWGRVMGYSQYYNLPVSEICNSDDISIVSIESNIYRDSAGAQKALDWYKSDAATASVASVGDFGFSDAGTTYYSECDPALEIRGVIVRFSRYNIQALVVVIAPVGSRSDSDLLDFALNLAKLIDGKLLSLASK